jgi:hypothetical protein
MVHDLRMLLLIRSAAGTYTLLSRRRLGRLTYSFIHSPVAACISLKQTAQNKRPVCTIQHVNIDAQNKRPVCTTQHVNIDAQNKRPVCTTQNVNIDAQNKRPVYTTQNVNIKAQNKHPVCTTEHVNIDAELCAFFMRSPNIFVPILSGAFGLYGF